MSARGGPDGNVVRSHPRGRLTLRNAGPLTVMLLGAVLAAGCSIFNQRTIATLPDGTRVIRLAALSAREAPPNPALGALAPLQVEASLRRITVRYSRIIGSNDPAPLFSERQAAALAPVLARELPTLAPKEHLRVSGHESYRGGSLEMDVYQDGDYLVYFFYSLGSTEGMGSMSPTDPIYLVKFISMPGQVVRDNSQFAEVRDPLLGNLEKQDQELRDKLALLQAARAEGLLNDAESAELDAAARAKPALSTDAWRAYLDKRRTLKRAREQGLMDDATYASQVKRIHGELSQ